MPGPLYSIPPGVDFLATLADALVTDRFGFGLGDASANPLALAQTTVYLPTRRAARVLRSEIADRLGGRSAILPVIRALGETDDDSGFFDENTPAALEVHPPIGGTDAVLSLAQLVLAWKSRLPAAITEHLQGAAMSAPANPADAIWMAKSLFDLVQSVEAEEADLARLDDAVEADLQQWWQLTAEFLRIARTFWPDLLQEQGRSSPAAHHNILIDAESAQIAAGKFPGPVVVAGSTGTRPSTARLIAAIAGHSKGAVVLPGLDCAMAPAHWKLIADLARRDHEDRRSPAERLASVTIRSHPQYGLYRLLAHLGVQPADYAQVTELGDVGGTLATRNRLVSLALLPSAATTIWSDHSALPAPEQTRAALSEVSLIEAANEREEAQALAAAMRAALEPTPTVAEPLAALVTPDRNLARRVVIELKRYGIEADDSGGRLLLASQAGSLARMAVEAAFAPGDPVTLAATIKHPLARFGQPAEEARRLAEIIELLGLRGGVGSADFGNLAARVTEGAQRRGDRHAPRAIKRLSDSTVAAAAAHAERIAAAFAPLLALFPGTGGSHGGAAVCPIPDLALATALTLERIVDAGDGSGITLWDDEAGQALARLLTDCRDSRAGLEVNGFEWIGALEALLSGQLVKPEAGGHPRALIWGTLEARLQHVDTVLLGGLNEGTWPAPGKEDPFLSRGMKAAIGLEPPERRIGQAAHDFQMAIAMPKVVLSRSLRVARAPTVASRWMQRLLATAGEDAAEAMRSRGGAILAHVREQEAMVAAEAPPGRPAPRPAADLQPTSYSFSEVGTLRRDPYAIYARRILDLGPIEEFVADPGPRERGTLYHAILEEFVRDAHADDLTEARLMTIADRRLAEAGLAEEIRTIWRNRLARSAPFIAEWEAHRADTVDEKFVEAYGTLVLPSGTELRGLADRIERLSDGSGALIDYKTGSTPSVSVARALLDPQLALEAHVLRHGGFGDIPAMPVSELLYLRLTGREKYEDRVDKTRPKEGELDCSAEALAERAVREFEGLVLALRDGRRGFMSRVIPKSARDFTGDYDHLARVAEWQVADEQENGGGDG